MFTLDEAGKRIYTLKKVALGEVTKSAHPARFSPVRCIILHVAHTVANKITRMINIQGTADSSIYLFGFGHLNVITKFDCTFSSHEALDTESL